MNSATNSRKPRYSIIIVTYNSRENIQPCLDSLRQCAKDVEEIIVVDNNSRDGTAEYLSAQPDIRPILNGTNNGFSKGCNQGAELAGGDFVIFLNPDTLVTPGWADAMARYFQDPAVGAVGPVSNYVAGLQRLDLNLPPQWRDARQFPGNGAREVADNIAGILNAANSGQGILTRLLIGFCLMMRRNIFTAMGGMDEKLFLGNDDLDLSWRLRNAGRKLVVATDAFVFHEGQKSFKTEAKSHVDNLTQESTDALYVKLVEYYGGAEHIPSASELWGIGWFSPSPALIEKMKSKPRKPETIVKKEPNDLTAWKGISALIFLGQELDASDPKTIESILNRSLDTLPNGPGPDILVLNCTGHAVASTTPTGAPLRKLDLGAACTPKQSLEIAVNLLPGSHLLFCALGVEFSTLFNHWLATRPLSELGKAFRLPMRSKHVSMSHGGGPGTVEPIYPETLQAFICRKDWLRGLLSSQPDIVDTQGFLAAINEKITLEKAHGDGHPNLDPPWLQSEGNDLTGRKPDLVQASPESWTAVSPNHEPDASQDNAHAGIDLYPECLQGAMRQAKHIAFAGAEAELPTLKGNFKVFNLAGALVPLAEQDLVILRVTPAMIDDLDQRLLNLRHVARNLKNLIVVINGKQARGSKPSQKTLLTPIDLTSEGIRAALMLAGFAVTAVRPYLGFDGKAADGADMDGWVQIEAMPRSTSQHTDKLVSIVILGFNQVEYTRKCLESIRNYTRQKYELILVDNGSKDGTEAYFHSISGAKVIVNPVNLGVAKGWNQGMRIAKGEYILILNNDIIVGPDWLENMIRLAESDPSLGLIGPRSNYIAGPQIVPNIPYKVEGEIQGFIAKWQEDHALSAAEFGFIKGFCHLIPRRVFEKVGFYDERFGKGNFEDDDYCMRVHHHGYRAAMANDSFIHHYGSVSFKQASVDWQALMVENQKKYTEKWSKGPAAIFDTMVEDVGPKHALPPERTTFEGFMKEGQLAYDRGDLQSASARFLEAQSQDPNHPEVYCALGVIQFHLEKLGDASALFQRCLELDPMHVDAAHNLFDCIVAGNGKVTEADLKALRVNFPANPVIAGYTGCTGENTGNSSEAKTEKPAWQIEMEGLIESGAFEPAFDRLEARLKSGQDQGACYNFMGIIAHAHQDAEMALHQFKQAVKFSPRDPDIIFNLADSHIALGRPREASAYLLTCVPTGNPDDNGMQVDFAASAEQINRAMALGNFDAQAYFLSRDANQAAESLIRLGRVEEAQGKLQNILAADPGDFRALNNLGLAAWYQGEGEIAWKHFTACLDIHPGWLDAVINAFDTALALGRIESMHPILKRARTQASEHAETFAAMDLHIQANGSAIYALSSFEALQQDAALLRKAEFAAKSGKIGEAITHYLDALKSRSQHPQALNGLGIIAFGEKRYEDAFGLFEAAVALNPMDQDILLNLWEGAQALRREKEVLPQLKLSLERNPAFEEVKAVVREFA